jgi:hypothetical protein
VGWDRLRGECVGMPAFAFGVFASAQIVGWELMVDSKDNKDDKQRLNRERNEKWTYRICVSDM